MKPKPSYAEQLRLNRIADRTNAMLCDGIGGKRNEIPALLKPAVTRKRAEPVAGVQSEADIRRAIMRLLNHHPKIHKAWTQASGAFQFEGANGSKRFFRANSAKGMADIQAILKGSGRGVFIECKTEKGRIMEHQQEFLDSMNAAGAVAFVARNVQQVIDKLNEI